jgi:TonB family protein
MTPLQHLPFPGRPFSLFLAVFLLPFISLAQKRIFLDKDNQIVDSSTLRYVQFWDLRNLPKGWVYVKAYKKNGNPVWEGACSRGGVSIDDLKKEGMHRFFRDNGKPWYQQEFKSGVPEGDFASWYPSGKGKCTEHFHAGKSTGGECYGEDGSPIPFKPFFQEPAFSGGETALKEYLNKNLKFPQDAWDVEMESDIPVRVLVSKEGAVLDARVNGNFGFGFEPEAERVVRKMPKFIPGLTDGLPADGWTELIIPFSLKAAASHPKSAPGKNKFDLISDVIDQNKRFYLNIMGQRADPSQPYERSGTAQKSGNNRVYVKLYDEKNRMTEEGDYSRFCKSLETEEGVHKYYDEKSHLLYHTQSFKAGMPDGESVFFDETGKITRVSKFADGTLVSSTRYLADGNPAPSDSATVQKSQTPPEFQEGDPGLMRFLAININYPPAARENNIQGTVLLSFVVSSTGQVQKIKVLEDIGGGCGMEAARLISQMPKWNPGKLNGQPEAVHFTLPIRFKLD